MTSSLVYLPHQVPTPYEHVAAHVVQSQRIGMKVSDTRRSTAGPAHFVPLNRPLVQFVAGIEIHLFRIGNVCSVTETLQLSSLTLAAYSHSAFGWARR